MATGNLYQLIDVQTMLSQQVLNVYYYTQLADGSSGSGSVNLESAFKTLVQFFVSGVQSTDVEHIGTRVINTDDPGDFVFTSQSDPGRRTAASLPPFVAWALRYNRSSRAVRNGQKRIAGVSEEDQNDGVINPALVGDMTLVSTAMGAILVHPTTGASFQPRIVRKVTVGGVTTYTPFGLSSVTYTGISSQNSRKFGHGS